MVKPIPAIVESVTAQAEAAVRAAFSSYREAEIQSTKADKRAEAARGALEMRRIELGLALLEARKAWPERGPNAKGWGEFLAREGIEQSTAWRLMDAVSPKQATTPATDEPRGFMQPHETRTEPIDTDFDPVPSLPVSPVRAGFDLRLGDWRSVLVDAGMVDAIIVDPPYGERTHRAHFRERRDGHDVEGTRPDYEAWRPDDVALFVAHWAPRTRGWMVALTSHDLAPAWEAAYVAADRYAFAPVPCVIRGMSVRLAGDGPSSWTVYAMVSRPRTGAFARWGTLPGAYVGGAQPGAESGRGKPLWLTDAIVSDYSRANDLVCDPLAGYGGTLISALDAGRRAAGAEIDHGAYDEAYRCAARPRTHDPKGGDASPPGAQTL